MKALVSFDLKGGHYMDYYEKILENHNCRLIEKDGCYITWKNPKGTVFTDDQAVISFMSEVAWDFWCNQ